MRKKLCQKNQSQSQPHTLPKSEKQLQPQCPAQIMPPQRSPSKYSQHLIFDAPLSPTLPSFSPPMLFSRSRSKNRSHLLSSLSTPRTRQRTKSTSNADRQGLTGIILCSDTIESLIIDHQLKITLKPLFSLKTIDNHKKVSNPYLFRGALMFARLLKN